MSPAAASILSDSRVQKAFECFEAEEPRILDEQIQITSIPAPPFGEELRARDFSRRLKDLGFRPVTDAIGNVLTSLDGFRSNPVVVAAHLDTVFPSDVPLVLRRRGASVGMPGISDNGCGLTALLALLRVCRAFQMRFRRPVVVVANVGEEGQGNLRGVRHLFHAPPWDGRECDFISIDGCGVRRIIHQALGSRRFRIRMTGPGGHSWADFGRPNPIHALSAAVHELTMPRLPRRSGTSLSVGVFRGGIAVNAIPAEAEIEVDIRSAVAAEIESTEAELRRAVSEAAGAVRTAFTIERTGERPGGCLAANSPLVMAAIDATRAFELEPLLEIGSTDANIPIALGLPGIAIGGGGSASGIHTADEWFDPSGRHTALQRLLLLVCLRAGLE